MEIMAVVVKEVVIVVANNDGSCEGSKAAIYTDI